jgi:hypothetical protein
MDEPKYSFKPTGQVGTFSIMNSYSITFRNNGQEIGKLDFNGPALVFTGDAEESAKVFIDWIARSFASRLEDERKAALAVPDAIGPNEDELPAYAAGWNDCRALMLEMRKP